MNIINIKITKELENYLKFLLNLGQGELGLELRLDIKEITEPNRTIFDLVLGFSKNICIDGGLLNYPVWQKSFQWDSCNERLKASKTYQIRYNFTLCKNIIYSMLTGDYDKIVKRVNNPRLSYNLLRAILKSKMFADKIFVGKEWVSTLGLQEGEEYIKEKYRLNSIDAIFDLSKIIHNERYFTVKKDDRSTAVRYYPTEKFIIIRNLLKKAIEKELRYLEKFNIKIIEIT